MPRNREEADLFFCSVTPLQNVRNENLVLFMILLFIFLFLLCASRLSTRQSKIDRPLGQLAIATAMDQGKGTRRDAEEAG
jgi:hypothetical protein